MDATMHSKLGRMLARALVCMVSSLPYPIADTCFRAKDTSWRHACHVSDYDEIVERWMNRI